MINYKQVTRKHFFQREKFMFNILVAEDDNNILKLMEIRLKHAGYDVFTAKDGEDALKKFEENHIDLIIADVMMPEKDGLTLISEIRASGSSVPAIMVTARGALEDKAQGFLVGIDDYMVKPIEFDELLFRIKALLRRAKIVSERKLSVGQVTLDYDALTVSAPDRVGVTLTKREFSILFKLLSYPELSFTKGQLFEEFWGYDSESDEDTVKVFINRIRSKIKDYPEIDVETIRGIGYKGVRHET